MRFTADHIKGTGKLSVIELPRRLGTRRILGTPFTCLEAESLRFGLDILTARAVPRRVLLT